jgi:hypothetical protein
MGITRYLLLLFFLAIISACGPKKALTRGDLPLLYKGASENEVSAIVGIPARCVLQPVGDESIRIDVYPMHASNYYGDYFLLYVDDKLRFWGYPYEYSRSSDSLISNAGLLITHSTFCTAKQAK